MQALQNQSNSTPRRGARRGGTIRRSNGMGWVGALIAFAATVAIVMVSNGGLPAGGMGLLQISGQTLTVLAWVVPTLAVATGVMITVFYLGKRAANR